LILKVRTSSSTRICLKTHAHDEREANNDAQI